LAGRLRTATRSRRVEGNILSQALATPIALTRPATRWIQLLVGLICVMAISSPQYVWTLFTHPLGAALGVAPAALHAPPAIPGTVKRTSAARSAATMSPASARAA
jgi:hypothetical protein